LITLSSLSFGLSTFSSSTFIVTPISTVTNAAGKAIKVGAAPNAIAITP